MDNNQSFSHKEQVKDILFKRPTYIDPLTGLFNRLYLYQFLPEEIKKAKLSNYLLAFLMIDLDGFKHVNDIYGHLRGDEILKEISEIFKKRVRRTDAVIRYAGDEFAILLPAINTEKAKDIANQIIEDVANNEFKGPENKILRLTISVGFAVCPTDAEEVDKLIDIADKALYLSKHKGKNRASHAKEVTLEAISFLAAMDSFPCQKFVDRESELNRLKQIFDIVDRMNILQTVFIRGDIGVGKTRMLKELKNYLHANDKVRVINCNGSPENIEDPYYLFANGIGTYLEEKGNDTLEVRALLSKIPFEEIVELSLLIPQLENLVKGFQRSEVRDNKARFLLFKAFLAFLIELNKDSIILISFDDIQYADKASLELLRYLKNQEKNKRILIVMSISEDKAKQMPKDSGLQEIWSDIHSGDNLTELQIGNLLIEDVKQMINGIFPPLGDAKEFVELLYGITKGNPCFIEETLKSLIENGFILYQENNWQIAGEITSKDISVSLEEVVKKRMKNLDEETKEMILQAAVMGDGFKVDLLRKIDDKDESFTLELINRVKKIHFIDELGIGDFRFVNKNIQRVLYNELGEEQRKNLHYKAANALAAQHKDNLYRVAGKLAFHFGKAPQGQDAANYSKIFSEMTSDIFNPYEVIGYLDKLTKAIISEESRVTVEISDEIRNKVLRLIRSFQGAIKNFHLYPPSSIVRTNSIKESYEIINDILFNKQVERIDISEVEKSLVINANRLSPKELQDANFENFTYFMMGRKIKTISFIKGLEEKEIANFIQYLSSDYQDIIAKGGWLKVFEEQAIEHIKIDEVRFIAQGASKAKFKDKDKLQDTMLMEFLLGKLDNAAVDRGGIIKAMKNDPKKVAEIIMETAESAVKEGKAVDKMKAVSGFIEKVHSEILPEEPLSNLAVDVAKVITELEPRFRNKLIRSNLSSPDFKQKEIADSIIKNISDEAIVDIITEEYAENPGNPLKINSLINELIKDQDRKKEVLLKLESRLSELGADKQDSAIITGQLKWEDLPIDKKINQLFQLLKDKSSMIESIDIKSILEQLYSLRKKEELDNPIYQLLTSADKFNYSVRTKITKAVADFIKEDFLEAKQDLSFAENRIDPLLERLKIETDPKNFVQFLNIFREIINDWVKKFSESKDIFLELEDPLVKKYLSFTNRLFYSLEDRLKLKEDYHRPVHECIRNFILGISTLQFLEVFAFSLVSSSAQDLRNMEDIFLIIGDPLVDALVKLEVEKISRLNESFEKYVVQKKVLNILAGLGDKSFNRLKAILLEENKNEEINLSLIELAGYLKKEEFMDSILPFINHKSPLVRTTAILAISGINTDKSLEIILQVAEFFSQIDLMPVA
ncbi:MAG: diguanylate cyclase [Candidatus Omnitrophota bacterium]